MREILDQIVRWRSEGKKIAVATNVRKDGSSLRPLGSKMAMTLATNKGKSHHSPEIAGSVTGGCVEGAVYEEGQSVIKNGQPKLLKYGIVEEDKPWEIGLTCGSSLEIFVESLDGPGWQEILDPLLGALAQNEKVALATVINGDLPGSKMLVWSSGQTRGSLGSSKLDEEAKEIAKWSMENEISEPKEIQGFTIFIDVLVPPARLIVIGAVHIAIPLVAQAKTLGFKTIVIDPREAFATRERFPETIADELLVEWPSDALIRLSLDEGTAVAALSHDGKLDNPALEVALKSKARYVGVLGTRKKISERKDVLKTMGVAENELNRLRAPIGINIKAVSPEEIALSILAEIVAVKHGL